DALVEAVRSHLPLMPVDEDRVDGHETKLAPHAQCCKQCRFAETNHGDVDRTADFQKAGLLEVTDDEGVVSLTLRVQSIADGLRRAAKFRRGWNRWSGGSRPWTSNRMLGPAAASSNAWSRSM